MEVNNEHRLTAVEERTKSNTKRLDEAESRLDDLTALISTVKVLAEKIGRMETDVTDMKNDVKTLANKPAKRWESLIEKALAAIVAAVVGFLFAKIGL